MVPLLVRPPPLAPGARIAVVAPGSVPPFARVPRGIAFLRSQGYRPWLHPSVPRRRAYLAGPDEARAGALQECFADPDIDAVFCAAGGYGSLRLLPLLDLEAIGRRPKVFLGFSDVTALHVALQQRAGMVTFHGPMAASQLGHRLPAFTLEGLWRAVTRPEPLGRLADPRTGLRVLAHGTARGRSLVGNMSILCSLMGTPWAPDARGGVLFLEETREHPCRLDEMLVQLRLAGVLHTAAAVVIARLDRCTGRDRGYPRWDPVEVLAEAFRGFDRPVLYGLEFGHTARMLTIPCGVEVEVRTDPAAVRILEPGVEPGSRHGSSRGGRGSPGNDGVQG